MRETDDIAQLIQWLSVLQEGKIRPDNSGKHSTVRDAKDNIPFINGINTRLAEILGVEKKETEERRY